jgi:hypothetical protein
LCTKEKRSKHGKRMDLRRDDENNEGAEWWSPRSFKRAGERQAQRQQAEEEEKLRKVDMKELKTSNALLNKKLQEERLVERERVRREREREKEKKAQEQAQKKQQKETENQAREARKIAQSSQIAPATISKKQAPKTKRVERCTGGVSRVNSEEAPLALSPKVTRTGRSITMPKKFR